MTDIRRKFRLEDVLANWEAEKPKITNYLKSEKPLSYGDGDRTFCLRNKCKCETDCPCENYCFSDCSNYGPPASPGGPGLCGCEGGHGGCEHQW